MLAILIIGGCVSTVAHTVKHHADGWIEGLAILIIAVNVDGGRPHDLVVYELHARKSCPSSSSRLHSKVHP